MAKATSNWLDSLSKEDRLYRMRHSAAHAMAEAVLEIFPEARFAIGPPIDTGFYYDFELPRSLSPDDLEEIERRMQAQIEQDIEFQHSEVGKQEAREIFANQPYKLELIEGIQSDVVSLYRHDGFQDLCE